MNVSRSSRAILPSVIFACVTSATSVWAAQSSEPMSADKSPEVALSLSVELSTDKSNTASLVGRATRSDWLTSGDRTDLLVRAGQLRKEVSARYATPTSWGGFQLATHEFKFAETYQYVTESGRFRTSQSSYRNMWATKTNLGLLAVGIGAEEHVLHPETSSAPFLVAYAKRNGVRTNFVPLLANWTYDRRVPNSLLPVGHLDQLSLEATPPIGGGMRFAKADYYHESYWLLSRSVSAGFNAFVGSVVGVGGTDTPLVKRYFGGGVGDVRGYTPGSLGPVDASGAATGANRKATLAAEAIWNAFSIGETPILLSIFSDVGRFVAAEDAITQGGSARSFGLGVALPTRQGLFRLSFARPLTDNLRTQHFQFDARATWN